MADVRRGIWQPPDPAPVVEPKVEPTFHEFASRYVSAREHEVEARTVEHWRWALTCHLLPHFAAYRLTEITPELVDGYKAAKVREREHGRTERPLSNYSINRTIQVLGAILDLAHEYGYVDGNAARGRRRRLKAGKPRRTWLELDEVRALLDAADEHRPLLATMLLGGLRVGEACGLRWRDLSLARARLAVAKAKTDAGVRQVELSPDLLDELKLHRARASFAGPDDLVFCTSRGTGLNRGNVRNRVLGRTIKRANAARLAAGKPPIQEGVTNPTLRRTFASLLYEAGASPAYVMAQMGHTSSALALEVYARKMERDRSTGARMDALVRGPEKALAAGTNGEHVFVDVAEADNEEGRKAAL